MYLIAFARRKTDLASDGVFNLFNHTGGESVTADMGDALCTSNSLIIVCPTMPLATPRSMALFRAIIHGHLLLHLV
jgi:hypothetical protein